MRWLVLLLFVAGCEVELPQRRMEPPHSITGEIGPVRVWLTDTGRCQAFIYSVVLRVNTDMGPLEEPGLAVEVLWENMLSHTGIDLWCLDGTFMGSSPGCGGSNSLLLYTNDRGEIHFTFGVINPTVPQPNGDMAAMFVRFFARFKSQYKKDTQWYRGYNMWATDAAFDPIDGEGNWHASVDRSPVPEWPTLQYESLPACHSPDQTDSDGDGIPDYWDDCPTGLICEPCPYDADGDGDVDQTDFGLLQPQNVDVDLFDLHASGPEIPHESCP